MKKVVLTLLIAVSFLAGKAQVYNSGGSITVASDAMLVIEGDYTSTGGGTIDNDGIVNLKGHFINNGGSMDAGSIGTLNFVGTAAQHIKGSVSTTFYGTVNINNANGVSLTQISESIAGILQFTSGKLTIGAFDLSLANNTPTAGADMYVVTNGTGLVKRTVVSTDADFPVGNSAFNPLILNNAGTADIYGVKVNDGTTLANHAVNRSWDISEETAGESNLTVTPQWNDGEVLTDFDLTDCAVGFTTDNGLTYIWASSGAASGTNPYTRTGSAFTGVGKYVVGDYFFEGLDLDLDVYLAGAYDQVTGKMRTSLKLSSLIPSSDPYGYGYTSVLPANAVDWIEVKLRDAVTQEVVKSFAFIVDEDGNVRNLNGGVGTKLAGITKGLYYVEVNHRNHLGAMTLNPVDLTSLSNAFDFTSLSSQVYGSNARVNINDKMMLWGGDTDGNGTVEYNTAFSDLTGITSAVYLDPGNPLFLSYYVVNGVYNLADTDLNGTVEFNTAFSDVTPITYSVYMHPLNTLFVSYHVVQEQLP